MSEVLYTRCPYCRTAFRTNSQQLAVHRGKVRCGSCRKVFNAVGHLVKLQPSPFLARPEYELEEDYDPMKGPQTMTLRRPLPEPPATMGTTPPSNESPAAGPKEEHEVREERLARASFEWAPAAPPSRLRWLYAAMLPLLLLGLVLQSVHHFRSELAAYFPVLRAPLEAYCEQMDCRVEPMREAALLTVEASDLQADPAHRGLAVLSVTLRNRAPYALAFPYLELSLIDAQAQVLARKVLLPAQYMRDPLALEAGMAGGEEKTLRIFLDTSAVAADGYRVERFYP
jgi:predicted Zn finger-like uncharacterized protein